MKRKKKNNKKKNENANEIDIETICLFSSAENLSDQRDIDLYFLFLVYLQLLFCRSVKYTPEKSKTLSILDKQKIK